MHLQENMFSVLERESVYMVYNINRWPQIYICKVLRFALVIRWIELRTDCYLSIPSYLGYLMPFLCHWSDHRFRMLVSGRLARKLYAFWYHSFLIRTSISFQTYCKLPFGYNTSICLSFNWFGSSPHCPWCKLTATIANIPSEIVCTAHSKCSCCFSFLIADSYFF